ncbi:MAG: ROK family protein [Chloroflexota bacterium]|nr:ROK family protein [Chloroflexota bacterium]
MKRLYLAVDLGGTHVRTAAADDGAQLMGRLDEPTRTEGGWHTGVRQIVEMARRSVQEAGVPWDTISRAIVASPGPLDRQRGFVFNPPNLAGWENVPLRDELERELGLDVTVDNDANAAALGEYRFGAGRGTRNLVYITVSTGIGAGIVSEGKLLPGTTGIAGEIGHTVIERNGPRCNCGSYGCLETLASGTAIARRYREALERENVPQGRAGYSTAGDVVRMATAGDERARAVFLDAADALGVGVTNAINLLNPDVVVIGGGVSKAGDLLFDTVRDVVARRALQPARDAARIVPAQLGEDVGLVGALAVGLDIDQVD